MGAFANGSSSEIPGAKRVGAGCGQPILAIATFVDDSHGWWRRFESRCNGIRDHHEYLRGGNIHQLCGRQRQHSSRVYAGRWCATSYGPQPDHYWRGHCQCDDHLQQCAERLDLYDSLQDEPEPGWLAYERDGDGEWRHGNLYRHHRAARATLLSHFVAVSEYRRVLC